MLNCLSRSKIIQNDGGTRNGKKSRSTVVKLPMEVIHEMREATSVYWIPVTSIVKSSGFD